MSDHRGSDLDALVRRLSRLDVDEELSGIEPSVFVALWISAIELADSWASSADIGGVDRHYLTEVLRKVAQHAMKQTEWLGRFRSLLRGRAERLFAFPDVRPIATCVGDDIALPVAFDHAECVLDMTWIRADCLQLLGAGTEIEHDAFEFARGILFRRRGPHAVVHAGA